jgi:hypothetical protein
VIVWLASYPRSGNTFLRMLLHEAFGLKTYSLAGTREMATSGEEVGRLVGDMNVDWTDAVSATIRSDTVPHFVKTHEEPISTNDPCIYVVRDGRSAVVSYHHYLREVDGLDKSLDDVIDGRVYAGSWSEHYLNWLPRHRQNTLLLRYEAITDDPNQAVEDVAAFLGMLPVRDFSIDFSYLHQLQPALFRVGDDAPNIAELGPSEPRFRERHGAVMRELGYYDP